MKIILASSSPRRKELLEQIGLQMQVVPSHLPESMPDGVDFASHVVEMARAKSLMVAAEFPDDVVLGADTLVICRGKPLGKPKDADDAFNMLSCLSGAWHQVQSGICLTKTSEHIEITDVVSTDVRFYPLSRQEIEEYVRSGEPFDKAGAYGIQGLGARFVQEIRGCFFNVVGLPLGIVWQRLKTFPEYNR